MFKLSVVTVITWINIFVFIAWHYNRIPFLEATPMYRHFLVSWDALIDGRFWVLLTSVFSHISLLHIFFNMYVLNSFGPILERVMGARAFLRFYLLAGILSSLAHASVSAFLLGKPDVPALGASGAISGVIMVFSLMYPKQILLLFGLIPIPALIGAFLFAGLDIWGLLVQTRGEGLPIGHGAHLGGAIFGFFYYFIILRNRVKKRSYHW